MFISDRNGALTDIVEIKGKYYYVDSCFTFDNSYETMVFPCTPNGTVTNWMHLYARWYKTSIDMRNGHKEIVENLENYLPIYYNGKE